MASFLVEAFTKGYDIQNVLRALPTPLGECCNEKQLQSIAGFLLNNHKAFEKHMQQAQLLLGTEKLAAVINSVIVHYQRHYSDDFCANGTLLYVITSQEFKRAQKIASCMIAYGAEPTPVFEEQFTTYIDCLTHSKKKLARPIEMA